LGRNGLPVSCVGIVCGAGSCGGGAR